MWARGFDAITVPLGLIRAHIAIEPLMSLESSFRGVIDPFASFLFVTALLRSCLVPTLLAGRLMAA